MLIFGGDGGVNPRVPLRDIPAEIRALIPPDWTLQIEVHMDCNEYVLTHGSSTCRTFVIKTRLDKWKAGRLHLECLVIHDMVLDLRAFQDRQRLMTTPETEH